MRTKVKCFRAGWPLPPEAAAYTEQHNLQPSAALWNICCSMRNKRQTSGNIPIDTLLTDSQEMFFTYIAPANGWLHEVWIINNIYRILTGPELSSNTGHSQRIAQQNYGGLCVVMKKMQMTTLTSWNIFLQATIWQITQQDSFTDWTYNCVQFQTVNVKLPSSHFTFRSSERIVQGNEKTLPNLLIVNLMTSFTCYFSSLIMHFNNFQVWLTKRS